MDYKIKGETLTAIANVIRDKSGSTEYIVPEEMPSGVENVYETGKEQGTVEWMKAYLQDGKRRHFTYAFYQAGWTDETYAPIAKVTDKIIATTATTNMFSYSKITDTLVPISIATSNSTNKTSTFAEATELVRVRGFEVSASSSMSSQFTNCEKLVELTIEGTIGRAANLGDCPLNRESIMSVINALSTTTSGLTCTFKKTAVDAAFQTSEGANDGSTSPEWTSMVDKESQTAIRPNWTFALK